MDVEKIGSHVKHDVVVFVGMVPYVVCVPTNPIVIQGETMTELLNGYLVAALHRVVSNPEHIERYSLPFLVKGSQ